MSRTGVTLKHPSGAKVRCTAHKRWAVARVTPGPEPRLVVVFRTDDSSTLMSRGRREATRFGEVLHVYRLRDGFYMGMVHPR